MGRDLSSGALLSKRVIRQFFEAVFSLWLLTTATFFLMRLLPGGPFDSDAPINPSVLLMLNKYWGFDQSISAQYFRYLVNLLRGDFGYSLFQSDVPIFQLIQNALSNTLLLNSLSLVFILTSSVILSWLLVQRERAWLSRAVHHFVLVCGALPSLFIGPILVYFLSYKWDLLPMAFLDSPAGYILPLLTLSVRPVSQLTRLLRQSWEEALSEPFVRTAMAKGLGRQQVFFQHAFRYAVPSVIAYLPSLGLSLFSGSVLVEVLFSFQGLGYLFVDSLNQRDYPAILGVTLFFGALVISFTSICEILRLSLDPRIFEETP